MESPIPVTQRLATRIASHRRWVVLAMLLALHVALVADPGSEFQRVWLLVHFGLFLLWQPFIAAERELEIFSGALLLGITAVTLYFLAGWMIVAWLLILLGILGGRVFMVQASQRNRFYLVAFGYVLAVLLLRAVPALVLPGQAVPEPLARFGLVALPLALLLLAVLPMGSHESESGQVFDFFYAVLVFQLGVVLVLGSIALMRYTHDRYFTSVALTVLGFGFALFVLAVLWNPLRGFGGLRTYFSRYLLSVGMPFELWVRRIAELAENEPDSRRFLDESFREIASLPWIRGAYWHSPDGEGGYGESGGFATRFGYHQLEVMFHTEIGLSPALLLHMRLLAQVVGEFYEGKRRESVLRQNAYMQAVHETGARLTHDVKNLLQSLYALTSMAPPEAGDGYGGLLQRQLPQLTKRLHATLEKLRAPEVAIRELAMTSRAWWTDLERRLDRSGVVLKPDVEMDIDVPAALFDGFIENAIDNAREKMLREPGIEISVVFACNLRQVELSVCDTGAPVDDAVTRKLFREPIERRGGLGIGLFQEARQARLAGYQLELAHNRVGYVCFTLARDGTAAPGSARED
ncbi:MAG TPA: sensor histidine kinase [Usitatibacter sp.]